MSELIFNTDTIRDQVAPTLESCCSNLADALSIVLGLPRLEGCEEIGSVVGKIDAIKSTISETKVSILEAASYAEQKEKESVGIIERLMTYVGGLLNFQNKITETILNNESIENPQGIVKLTDYDGSYAGGKINLRTQAGLLSMAQFVHDNQMDWRYSGMGDPYPGLQYSNFEDVLNNPNKATCCATYVSEVLYRCGLITHEDVSSYAGFNPNYPLNLSYGLDAKGWEKIEAIDNLEPGDVVFGGPTDWNVVHVEIFAGIDENTGGYSWYSAGSDEQIKSVAPIIKESSLQDLMESNWWAYRPDYDENEVEEDNNSSVIKGLGINNSSINMIMDKQVVEILANKYDVDTAGKTAVSVLDEIAIKCPELAEGLNDIKGMIDSNIEFE